jgi:5-methylthioadenosine/S-adenosylhomocysteine deaminase
MEFDFLLHNALVLTLEPGAEPLENGYVAIQGGKIAAVGQAGGPDDLPAARARLGLLDALVMPGLVNTHCHAPMVWFRGLADDLPLSQWLNRVIFPAESAWLNRERVYWGAMLAAAEMLRAGITTVADGYFFETEVRRAMADAGLRGVLAQGLVDFPAPDAPDPRHNLRVARNFVDSGADFHPDRLISTLFCHASYTCGPETLTRSKDLTRRRNLPWFIHLAETQAEVAQLRQQTGLTPAAYLDSLGLLDERTVAVHGVWLSPEDLDLLARRRVKLSHCPRSNLKLGSGVAPIPELLARGVTVGLGTDGAASNNRLDLWSEMSLTARLHKGWHQDPTLLPARQVAALATREGARVLGLEDRIGALSPGKDADLVVLDLTAPHLTPMFDPYSHLVYAARGHDVRHVMVAGRWLMFDRHLTTIDWPALASRIRRDSLALAGRTSRRL